MNTKIGLAAGVLSLLTGACAGGVVGSGHVVTETRAVPAINAVNLAGVGELTIVQGDKAALVVEAEDNILPSIKTRTEGGTLEIREKGSIAPKKPLRFRLTVSQLNKIVVSGAGGIRSDRFANAGLLDLEAEGAGSVELTKLECPTLKLVISGAGDVKLQGRARNQDVEIAGAGKYLADEFRTEITKLEISGDGTAQVWAIGELEVSISGVGQVDYYGKPKLKKDITGLGKLHALGPKGRDE